MMAILTGMRWYRVVLICISLMASPTWWAWVWVNSRSWWWTGGPGMLWFMGLQRLGHDWATELTELTLHDIQYGLEWCLCDYKYLNCFRSIIISHYISMYLIILQIKEPLKKKLKLAISYFKFYRIDMCFCILKNYILNIFTFLWIEIAIYCPKLEEPSI